MSRINLFLVLNGAAIGLGLCACFFVFYLGSEMKEFRHHIGAIESHQAGDWYEVICKTGQKFTSSKFETVQTFLAECRKIEGNN